jgi:transcriptional regulator with XRE-family HTH domain
MRRLDPQQVLRNVGRRVAEIRWERGLTQEEFAAELKISTKYVQKIEMGRTNMTLHTLVEWANRLGVDPAEFLRPTADGVRKGRPPVKKGPGHARAPSKRS